MKKKTLFTKIIAFVMTIVMLCPCLFSVTASAVTGGQNATDDFQKLSLEELKGLSQKELAEYCQELAEYKHSQEESKIPNINPFWASEANTPSYDYRNAATTATHYYIALCSYLFFATSSSLADINKINLTTDEIYTILDNSETPDRVGHNFLWVSHFYDPDSEENCIGSKVRTAKSVFLENYKQGETYLKLGLRQTGLKEFGKSLHYIQDVCEPHHSNNIKATDDGSTHTEFETWVGNNLNSLNLDINITDVDYNFAKNSEPEDIFIKAAWSSRNQLSNVSGKNQDFRTAAEVSVGNAILYSTLILYHFMVTNGLCSK